MSEPLPKGWKSTTLGNLARRLVNGGTPPTGEARYWNGKIPWITGADFTSSGLSEFRRFVSEEAASETATNVIEKGQLLIVTRTGVGKLAIAPCDVAISQDITGFYVDQEQAETEFLYHRMRQGVEDLKKLNQGTSINGIVRGDLIKYEVNLPSPKQQRRIAEILTTVDEAMEQTEALVGKLEQMKAGLMHDLFTRGVTPDGHLRPTRQEAPRLYHETPLGWLPKEWHCDTIGSITDSVVDGPFGSNLKTEHYVVEPGVRVVRLQNVDEGKYNDEERAFVSESHANFLMRNQVLPGDVLIAGLGEDNNVVGRACCYPDGLPPAINKADCFRLRCLQAQALNAFVMFFLNTAAARRQVRRFEQGVTRRRINTGNMKKIIVSLPSIAEQQLIVQRLVDAGAQIELSTTHLAKLRQQKQGLMQDLLTGRVPVDA
jgi:type I restriction enzyme, S subunit